VQLSVNLKKVHIDQQLRVRTQYLCELFMARDGLWCLSDIHLTHSDVYGAVTFLRIY